MVKLALLHEAESPDPFAAIPHLKEWCDLLPPGQPLPAYYEQLPTRLEREANPHLVYPVGDDVFVYIGRDLETQVLMYQVIEPDWGVNVEAALEALSAFIMDAAVAGKADHPSFQRPQLEELAARFCAERPRQGWKEWLGLRTEAPQPRFSERELSAIRYRCVRDRLGTGKVEPFLRDPYLEDIFCSGAGPLFVQHKLFGSLVSDRTFDTADDVDTFILGLSDRLSHPVSYREPIVDATLPDGSRINLVFGQQISDRGSNFSIRRRTESPISLIDLLEFGTVNPRILAYLSLTLKAHLNLFVVGEAASGKTTFLNAVCSYLSSKSKVVSLEDTRELQLPHHNWVAEVVPPAQAGAAITMFDLIKASMRQRPDALVIGELRGQECNQAIQAMQTGHLCLSTMHAGSTEMLMQRMSGAPISVPKEFIAHVNVVVVIRAVTTKNGLVRRRVTHVSEILGYDETSGKSLHRDVFTWNPFDEAFQMSKYDSTFPLYSRIAQHFRFTHVNQLEQELQRRTEFFERLWKGGSRDFYECFKALEKLERSGLGR